MKLRYAALLFLVGCAASPPRDTQPRWLLLASPPTVEYPEGCNLTPIARWSGVAEYASLDGCEDSTRVAYNALQLPVQCVVSDDPRLKSGEPVRVAAWDSW